MNTFNITPKLLLTVRRNGTSKSLVKSSDIKYKTSFEIRYSTTKEIAIFKDSGISAHPKDKETGRQRINAAIIEISPEAALAAVLMKPLFHPSITEKVRMARITASSNQLNVNPPFLYSLTG